MIKNLLSNLTILFSLTFLYVQLTNSSPLIKTSPLSKKILAGIMGGLLSNILMQYSIHLGTTIIDLRHIPIILLSYYGGAVPAFVAMILIIIGRFLIGINTSSYSAVALITVITLGSVYFSKQMMPKKSKALIILTFSNIVYLFLYLYLIRDVKTLIWLIPANWAISYLAGFISFYTVDYLRESQSLFNRYKLESSIDQLTGLNNVRHFDEIFNRTVKEAVTKHKKLTLLYIDIDFFKKINDTYGHNAGDIVLRELGTVLKSSVRSNDIVSRKGGEEFTAILLDCALNRAVEVSERMRKAVEEHPFRLDTDEIIHITISIGLACFDETTKDAALLIEDADKALYNAKRSGRNKVCIAS